jgi:hypothetical protein
VRQNRINQSIRTIDGSESLITSTNSYSFTSSSSTTGPTLLKHNRSEPKFIASENAATMPGLDGSAIGPEVSPSHQEVANEFRQKVPEKMQNAILELIENCKE